MTSFHGVHEANVFGVAVPGYDGRAGMAAVILTSSVPTSPQAADQNKDHESDPDGKTMGSPACPSTAMDWTGLFQHFHASLSNFQIPYFVRVQLAMDVTVTFKHRKVDMVAEGFDPSAIKDPMFFRTATGFIPLTEKVYQNIVSGKERL